jgi:peroxiredoxin
MGTAVATSKATAAVAKGMAVGKLAFRDLDGKSYSDSDLRGAKATVFVFLSTECPISSAYTGRIARLAREYQARGVRFFGVNANDEETAATVAQDAKERGFPFPFVKDAGGVLAARLGASINPQAVLLDRQGAVRYQGRIDDNRDAARVSSHDLQDALEAVLAGKPVAVAKTEAFGCAIGVGQTVGLPAGGKRQANSLSHVTYTRDVAPILQKNCQGCHRPGEIGPFPLMSYEQARRWAVAIKDYTGRRAMPPWKAESGVAEYANTRALTEAEIATLGQWADAGAPQGDPKELPPPRKFVEGWTLGEPDLVLEPTEAYSVAAEGDDVYRCFVLPPKFTESRYIAAIEARPGNRAVVHHVIAYLDTTGISEKLDAADPEPGYTSTAGFPGFQPSGFLGGWAPGNTPGMLPEGIGNELPANSRIVMEVHYHKNGKPQTDRTRLGIWFSRGTVDKKLRMAPIVNSTFRIPPGAERHEVRAGWTVPRNSIALGVLPHMHLLGRDIEVSAKLPDGTTKRMVHIKDWDFNWQETYSFKEPIALPEGTRITVVAYYDNSEKNPRNIRRPLREVGWGEQTTDEMCVAFVPYLVDDEHLSRGTSTGPDATGSGPPVNVAGTWAISMATPAGAMRATVTFQQEGAKLTGTYHGQIGPEAPITGSVRGDQVTFKVEAKAGERTFAADFSGKLADTALGGTWEFGTLASGKWTAARQTEAAKEGVGR